MAKFTSEGIGEAQGSPFSPIKPAVDQSSAGVMDALGKAVEYAGKHLNKKAKVEAMGVIDRFTEDQVLLADAVEQGTMTSSEARTRARKNFLRYSADNPGISDDLVTRHKQLLSEAGLAKVLSTGTEAEQQRIKMENKAMEDKFIRPGDNAEARAEGVANWTAYNAAAKKLQAAQANVTYSSSSLALQENRKRVESQEALFNLSAAYTPKLNRDFADITNRVNSGEITREEAVAEVNVKWGEVTNISAQVGGRAGGTFLKNLTEPMEIAKDNTLAYLSGDMELKALQSDNEIAEAQAMQFWMSDPAMAKLAAGQKLLRNSDMLTMFANTQPVVLEHINRLTEAEEPEDVPNLLEGYSAGKTSVPTTLKILSSSMRDVLSGKAPSGMEEQLDAAFEATLTSVDIYKDSVRNPKQFQNVVDHFASDVYGSYAVKKGGIASSQAVKAKEALQAQYETEVIPVLKKEYEEKTKRRGRSQGGGKFTRTMATEIIKPAFNGSGMSFTVQPGIPKEDVDWARSVAKDLNSRVAPAVNKLVRMTAHLDANKNYRKVYEANYSTIFGEELPEEGTTNE